MNYVKYTDSPKINDTVGFILDTYGDDGVLKNPYVVEKIFIYHIEKNIHVNDKVLQIEEYHPELEKVHINLQEMIQKEPSEENLSRLTKLKNKMRETAKVTKFFYSEARMVVQTTSPLWSEKIHNIVNLSDSNKQMIPGKFLFVWLPKNMREGTYLIRWNWKNTKDGVLRSAEKLFTLYPAEEKINSIYSKFVPRDKYNFLFDKYIPPMYRRKTTPNDITPEVLVKFNRAIAQSLLELDDLAVGLVDLLSPTYIPDGFLPVMANFFNMQLRSSSSAAWRNQIKHALPLFKKKGTISGLREALDKAGISLIKLTNLWQVISPYTWTDGFVIDRDIGLNSDIIGNLSKTPVKDTELEISIKSAETREYFNLGSNLIHLQDVMIPEPKIAVIWNGTAHNPPIELFKGDVIKIRYNYNRIPEDARSIENYLKELPLADQRDETKIKYPLKNWNVKLIEEDDPLFDLLIPERHSFQNLVTFGKIRTTFLYSEKAFNMDTYNGSLYNSNNQCDIDKDFIDPCSGGQSSKFNVHLEFDQATDERIEEAKEIIIDYSPFHAILNNMKISNRAVDFIVPPVEKIKSDIKNRVPAGDNVSYLDAVYCQIRYKDGRVENGRLV